MEVLLMSCPIDHSVADVKKKLAEQKAFLPERISVGLETYITDALSQDVLNDIFHLLKKYDLASEEERAERDDRFARYV